MLMTLMMDGPGLRIEGDRCFIIGLAITCLPTYGLLMVGAEEVAISSCHIEFS
ncbi:MAG: hypothetical protein ACUVX8_08355 [Candidatus Zipacnadales bacterium]